MTSIIQTSVLRAAVLSAFDRGRYSVTFATTPAGDDLAVVPSAIILNLEEQDDDLLGSANDLWPELFTDAEERELRREVRQAFGADDHGPAVPAQDGTGDVFQFWDGKKQTRVYEFALQDADMRFITPKTLGEVQIGNAPDMNAFHAADWVHVYDRATRERRTLKRPAEDKLVKGLADVAADLRSNRSLDELSDIERRRRQSMRAAGLRGGPVKGPFADKEVGAEVCAPSLRDAFIAGGDPLEQALASVLEGHEGRVSKPGEWRVWRDGDGRARWERFTQFEAVDPAPVPPPAPGPLTSAEGLMRGDVLRIIQCGTILRFDAVIPQGERYAGQLTTYLGDHDEEPNAIFPIHQLAFVGRPDADGWMDWRGGENPVGDEQTVFKLGDVPAESTPSQASKLRWNWIMSGRGGDIVRFRLVDMPSLPSDT